VPSETYSAHYIAHPGLRRAVAEFLVEERAERAAQMEALAEYAPFREAD
jgi:predicted N-acyltransferase